MTAFPSRPARAAEVVEIPREVARDALLRLMSEISQDCWGTGWLGGTELSLWRVMCGTSTSRTWTASEKDITTMRVLSAALGEWPDPAGAREDSWVPLAHMEKIAKV